MEILHIFKHVNFKTTLGVYDGKGTELSRTTLLLCVGQGGKDFTINFDGYPYGFKDVEQLTNTFRAFAELGGGMVVDINGRNYGVPGPVCVGKGEELVALYQEFQEYLPKLETMIPDPYDVARDIVMRPWKNEYGINDREFAREVLQILEKIYQLDAQMILGGGYKLPIIKINEQLLTAPRIRAQEIIVKVFNDGPARYEFGGSTFKVKVEGRPWAHIVAEADTQVRKMIPYLQDAEPLMEQVRWEFVELSFSSYIKVKPKPVEFTISEDPHI